MSPIAVLIHVPNVDKGLAWYQTAFPAASPIYHPESNFTALDCEGFHIEIVQADEKVSNGKCGSVLYWSVEDLTTTLRHFEALGARLYRGPMKIENGLSMCQLEDPFGNLIGLRGPGDEKQGTSSSLANTPSGKSPRSD
ncbi:VOC family protein [Thaumasiovibrio subtropicus]|uniref:VOC family protein n=1 Tax=Thaumasiovibrio subtropicus TaxID=1891207 RepID=UPI001FE48529|nr:VOC family protein [Thaumasiovibrio subtropicus]